MKKPPRHQAFAGEARATERAMPPSTAAVANACRLNRAVMGYIHTGLTNRNLAGRMYRNCGKARMAPLPRAGANLDFAGRFPDMRGATETREQPRTRAGRIALAATESILVIETISTRESTAVPPNGYVQPIEPEPRDTEADAEAIENGAAPEQPRLVGFADLGLSEP